MQHGCQRTEAETKRPSFCRWHFKLIFLNELFWIKCHWNLFPMVQYDITGSDNVFALNLNPRWLRWLTHIRVTRPQYVKLQPSNKRYSREVQRSATRWFVDCWRVHFLTEINFYGWTKTNYLSSNCASVVVFTTIVKVIIHFIGNKVVNICANAHCCQNAMQELWMPMLHM